MKRINSILILTLLTAISLFTVPALAGTGSIRIDPPLPYGSDSPAVFEVWTQGGVDANDPHIFLVMTEACYDGLVAPVVVEWDGGSVTLPKGTDWTKETSNGVKVPPGTAPGAGYTVASLKDHLNTSGAIYWAMADLWEGPLNGTKQTLTITLESGSPEMLVYILGKSGSDESFSIRVPPTIPGFVVPELPIGAIGSIVTMLGAYIAKKRLE